MSPNSRKSVHLFVTIFIVKLSSLIKFKDIYCNTISISIYCKNKYFLIINWIDHIKMIAHNHLSWFDKQTLSNSFLYPIHCKIIYNWSIVTILLSVSATQFELTCNHVISCLVLIRFEYFIQYPSLSYHFYLV